MDNLGNNVWLVITNIIYKINSVESLTEMREEVLRQLKWVIPFDRATFYLASGETERPLRDAVADNFPEKYIRTYLENYTQLDYSKGIKLGGSNIVYLESDLYNERIWLESTYYKTICAPNGIRHIAHTNLAYDQQFLGIMSLYRHAETIDFTQRDIFILNLLKEHLALRLYRDSRDSGAERDVDDVERATFQFGLTPREMQVLKLVVRGLENPAICDKLSISPNTLKKHVINIYRKAGVNSRIQLLRAVREADLALG